MFYKNLIDVLSFNGLKCREIYILIISFYYDTSIFDRKAFERIGVSFT